LELFKHDNIISNKFLAYSDTVKSNTTVLHLKYSFIFNDIIYLRGEGALIDMIRNDKSCNKTNFALIENKKTSYIFPVDRKIE